QGNQSMSSVRKSELCTTIHSYISGDDRPALGHDCKRIRELSGLLFCEDLAHQLHQLNLNLLQLPAAVRREFVISSDLAFVKFVITLQEFGFLQRMKQRIERSRANSIAVLGEFFDQPESVDRAFRCVMQDVKLDEAS